MDSISATPERMLSVISRESMSPSCFASTAMAILIPPSGLRISCATPAAIWPSDARVSCWISRRCSSCCSVRSRSTPTVPSTCPLGSKMGVTARWAGNSRPPRVRARTSPFHA